jgi:hypothetical protein
MGVLARRWTITFDSEGRPRDVGEHADARALHNGWTTVEVIPAADARGAVAARDNAEAIVTALCEITGEPVPDEALNAVRARLLTDPRGQ